MAGRRLAPDEQALWDRVAASVRPLAPDRVLSRPIKPMPAPASTPAARPGPVVPRAPSPARPAGGTLDGSWDRALRRGGIEPDMVIDLHGHTLASAHAALDRGLERALAGACRVILLVTGRAPRDGLRRGVIHASFRDWLAASPHARRVAAVRPAHPRHGGNGAFYVVLRRNRATS